MLIQRRTDDRARTLLKGRIVFHNRFSTIDCVVRDLSVGGARIAFDHPIDIPDEFELEVPTKNLFAKARVVWSNGKEHGVTFVCDSLGAIRPGSAVCSGGQDVAGLAPEGLQRELGEGARLEITAALAELIADYLALYVKTRAVAWHVNGASFAAVHALLADQSDELLKQFESLAERQRLVGGWMLRSLDQASRLTSLRDDDADFASARAMVEALQKDNNAMSVRLRKVLLICETHGDCASGALIGGLIERTEKRSWALVQISSGAAFLTE